MKKWEKYLNNLPLSLQKHIFTILQNIFSRTRYGLDIQPLQGQKNIYRCRTGKLRIIFEVRENHINIIAIGPRGDIYK